MKLQSPSSGSSPALDRAALTLSTLCLIHCLLLPALAVALPLAGLVSEMEWVHRLFVLIALPVSAIAFLSPIAHPARNVLRAMALVGAALLVAGAFVEALHDHETLLTVSGALFFGAAHLLRVRFRRHLHGSLAGR